MCGFVSSLGVHTISYGGVVGPWTVLFSGRQQLDDSRMIRVSLGFFLFQEYIFLLLRTMLNLNQARIRGFRWQSCLHPSISSDRVQLYYKSCPSSYKYSILCSDSMSWILLDCSLIWYTPKWKFSEVVEQQSIMVRSHRSENTVIIFHSESTHLFNMWKITLVTTVHWY